jgi:hypothetical protein
MNPIQSILLSFIALSLFFTVRMIHKTTKMIITQQVEQADSPLIHDLSAVVTTSSSSGSASIFNNITTIEWRDEMQSLSSPSLSYDISNIRKATYKSHCKGCGVSMMIKFNDTFSEKSSSKTAEAFFKLQISENNTHYDAESHVREILASYLDTVLKTNVVPPCIGYTLEINENKKNIDQDTKNKIYNYTSCSTNTNNTSTLLLDGSLMMYVPNVTQIWRGYEIAYTAYVKQRQNAIRYSIFLYLAGCVKSRHNHFGIRHSGHHTMNNTDYVAIDNDRCFAPQLAYNHIPLKESTDDDRERFYMWEKLVLTAIPCQALPADIINNLKTTSATATVSSRLIEVSSNDVLWPTMKSFFTPTIYKELDERVENLLQRYDQCNIKNSSSTGTVHLQ